MPIVQTAPVEAARGKLPDVMLKAGTSRAMNTEHTLTDQNRARVDAPLTLKSLVGQGHASALRAILPENCAHSLSTAVAIHLPPTGQRFGLCPFLLGFGTKHNFALVQ